MPNVTIKLTVDTVAVLNDVKNPELGTNCWLSQTGGEEIQNYMIIDPLDSTQNQSHVTVGDVITWVGMPANPDLEATIDIISIVNNNPEPPGGSVFSNPLNASWPFGNTVISQVMQDGINSESYTIVFSINSSNITNESIIFSFDPKIRVHPSPTFEPVR